MGKMNFSANISDIDHFMDDKLLSIRKLFLGPPILGVGHLFSIFKSF